MFGRGPLFDPATAISAGAVGIGGISSLFGADNAADGARDAANAQVQAGRDAMTAYDTRTAQGAARQMALLYGPAEAEKMIRGTFDTETANKIFGRAAKPGSMTTQEQDRRAQLQADRDRLRTQKSRAPQQWISGEPNPAYTDWLAKGGPDGLDFTNTRLQEVERELAQLDAKAGGQDEIKGSMDRDAWNAMGPGLSSEMEDYRKVAEGKGRDTLTSFDGDTSALLRDSMAIEKGAQDFGEIERQRINRDSGDALTGLNRMTESKLRGMGLGSSSVLGNQLAGNTREVFNSTQDQLGALGDRQIGLRTGLKKDTLGLKSGRMNQRTGLGLSLDERDLNLRAKPLDMKLQSFTGAAMNPWLGQNTTQYFPGVSGDGAASQTWGNMMSGMGGQFAGAGAYGLLKELKDKKW